MFRSVLIANRGEIAVRIARTLRAMGVRAVVVASIPDRRSLAVRTADACVLLEGYSAAESYLDEAAIIAAAKAEGCEAIHPGYGFLSERAGFAQRCAAEGLTFIGPPPEVLRGLGDKVAARQLALGNGVPVVPGWDGADDEASLVREAATIGFPVMLKARGGGGGRGMREVHAAEELREAIESARREATAAFGDGGLLLERLVTGAHHIEVQVIADRHGNVIHLGERDCSVQRRHQKLIEETPSPVVDAVLRERLTGYALKLARAIGYVNAGTFEFLVVPNGGRDGGATEAEVYFLEVNPRLQVEHPVTEMVTGLDLVELQLRVAAGEPLPLRQEDVAFRGHAIELRINAEDPWDGFKPSSGRIGDWDIPRVGRCDSGFAAGDSVPPNYDSLLAKVIEAGHDRESAIERAADAARRCGISGVSTNVGLLRRILQHPGFAGGGAGVDWLERELAALLGDETPPVHWAVAIAALAPPERSARDSSPWTHPPLWIGAGERAVWLSDGRETRLCHVRFEGASVLTNVGGVELAVELVSEDRRQGTPESLWRTGSPARLLVTASRGGWEGEAILVNDDAGQVSRFVVVPPPVLPRRAHAAAEGATAITAPLAGTIAAVRVAEGDRVEEGQLLAVLEAMKMEHRIAAPCAGVIKAVHVRERDVVSENDALIDLV